MRTALLVVVLGALGAAVLAAQAPAPPPATVAPAPQPRIVGTMSELMVHLIRPTSDAIFYITSRTPTTSEAWTALQAQALTLAESANLLMLPAHARGRRQWLDDADLMREAGRKAFAAAKARDVAALEALNDELYQSCVTCHEHFRPGYGKRPGR
ncbi:MAG: hypothetical protein AB7U83_20665 [Vicinamibacterales bacterium]